MRVRRRTPLPTNCVQGKQRKGGVGEEANSSRLASNSFNSDNGEASLLKTVNQVITAKLKLNLTTEQKASVRETALAYRDALNFTSDAAFDNDKSSNGALVTKACLSRVTHSVWAWGTNGLQCPQTSGCNL